MRSARALSGNFYVLGGRVPVVVALLMGLTLGGSILGAVSLRNGLPLLLYSGVLSPERVGAGEVWRLLTWVFFETDPLSLIFACLGLWWFGRDLAGAWGPVRFLLAYLGLAVGTGAATCLLAWLLWPGLARPTAGPWPLITALLIAWAVLYPQRNVLVWFVLPLHGRNLIYATIGGTVLFALLGGVEHYVPHFIAQGLMMVYVRQSLRRLWLRFRLALQQRSARRRSSYIRPVDRSDRSEPPRWLH
jgi:membrane associated rhomboid family serine protease